MFLKIPPDLYPRPCWHKTPPVSCLLQLTHRIAHQLQFARIHYMRRNTSPTPSDYSSPRISCSSMGASVLAYVAVR